MSDCESEFEDIVDANLDGNAIPNKAATFFSDTWKELRM